MSQAEKIRQLTQLLAEKERQLKDQKEFAALEQEQKVLIMDQISDLEAEKKKNEKEV